MQNTKISSVVFNVITKYITYFHIISGNTMSASSTALGSGTSIIKVESLKRKREDEDDYDKM